MRCLERDKQLVWAAFFVEKKAVEDAQGRLTGRHEVVRSDPCPFLLSVSASKGTAENSPFGIDLDYDRTVVVEDVELPFDESTVFWIDNAYDLAGGLGDVDPGFSAPAPKVPYDYTVKRVAKSPNCIAIAVKHVEVSG